MIRLGPFRPVRWRAARRIQEIGLLSAALQAECAEIEDQIELLNESLRQLEYRRGTHMRLETKLVSDQEIAEFREALARCLPGVREKTLAPDEARYVEIEKLVRRLRDEERWRAKVVDVRRWRYPSVRQPQPEAAVAAGDLTEKLRRDSKEALRAVGSREAVEQLRG